MVLVADRDKDVIGIPTVAHAAVGQVPRLAAGCDAFLRFAGGPFVYTRAGFRSRCLGGGKTGAIFLASRGAGSSLRHRRRPTDLLYDLRAGRADALRPRDARHAGDARVRRRGRRHRRRQHRQARRMALAARRPRQPDLHLAFRRRARRGLQRADGHFAADQRSGAPARRARAARIFGSRRLRTGTAAAPAARRVECRPRPGRAPGGGDAVARQRRAAGGRPSRRERGWKTRIASATFSGWRRRQRCGPRDRPTSSPRPGRCWRGPPPRSVTRRRSLDGDGTVRADAAALRVGEDTMLPSLATAVAASAFGVAAGGADLRFGDALHLGERVRTAWSAADDSSALLPAQPAQFTQYPYWQVMAGDDSRRAAARQDRDHRLPRLGARRRRAR